MSRSLETNGSRKVNKTNRIPMSGSRDVLKIEGKEDGFAYRIVNDTPGRIQRLEAAGYEVCSGDDLVIGQRSISNNKSIDSVATKSVGKGTTAVTMRIKEEWFKEDQAAKQKIILEKEKTMKRELNSGNDGTYGKVEIS